MNNFVSQNITLDLIMNKINTLIIIMIIIIIIIFIIKGRFLKIRRYHNFANLFYKLSESNFSQRNK